MVGKPPDELGPQKKPPELVVKQEPPKVDASQVAARPPLNAGESQSLEPKTLELRFKAPQDMHARPSGTLAEIAEFFQGMHPDNRIFIPQAVSPSGNADKTSGWQDLTFDTLFSLDVKQGCELDFAFAGPNARQMCDVVTFAFRDGEKGFARRSGLEIDKKPNDVGYTDLFQQGVITNVPILLPAPSLENVRHSSTLDLRQVVAGSEILEGPGAGTGMAVYGLKFQDAEKDFGQHFRLCDRDEISHEAERLHALQNVMTTGRVRSVSPHSFLARLLGISGGEETVMLIQGIRKDDAKMIDMLINNAAQIMALPLDRRGPDTSVAGPPENTAELHSADLKYPNAEMAIEIGTDLTKFRGGQRQKLEETKQMLLEKLTGGLAERDTMAYVLGELISAKTPNAFKRAGIFMLRLDTSDKHFLETRFEWKEQGFVEMEHTVRIPLDTLGDGTAFAARQAISTGRHCAFKIDHVSTDPRTRGGYREYERCAWSTIHSPSGRLLGVMWADNMDSGPIPDDMVKSLEVAAAEAGQLISLMQTITEIGSHAGQIVVSKRTPTDDRVLELIAEERAGFASRGGSRACHGVILAGGCRFPGAVGLRDRVLEIPDKTPILIVDPADNRPALLVANPTKSTLAFFGLTKVGDSISIEPENVEIKDTVLKDGVRINLRGTLQGIQPQRLERFLRYGSEGVGLLRSEHAITLTPPEFSLNADELRQFNRDFHRSLSLTGSVTSQLPQSLAMLEDYFVRQYSALLKAIEVHGGPYAKEPVTIRLLDLTPDKYPKILRDACGGPDAFATGTGLKFLLSNPGVLVPQVRGINRIAQNAVQEIVMMVPNVETVQDSINFSSISRKIQESISPGRHITQKFQIETPAAVDQMPGMLDSANGFSFGTNDLVVNAFGLPGRDAIVNQEFSPTILRLLKKGLDTAKTRNLPCMVCGCLAESPEGVALLAGLGFREVSVPPRLIPQMREVLPNMSSADYEAIAREVLSGRPGLTTDEEVFKFVQAKLGLRQ